MQVLDRIELYVVNAPLPAPFAPSWMPGTEMGLKFTPHCWSNGFGFIVNAHVFAASGFAGEMLYEYPLAPPGWVPEGRDAIIVSSFVHDRGWFHMPQKPGLGFEIDHAALARHGRCFFKASRQQRHWMPEALADLK